MIKKGAIKNQHIARKAIASGFLFVLYIAIGLVALLSVAMMAMDALDRDYIPTQIEGAK